MNGFLFFLLAIALGYCASKWKLVPESTTDSLPAVLLNLCFPALVLDSFATSETQLSHSLATVIVTLVTGILPFFAVSFLLRKADRERRTLLGFINSIGNVSFVCIPLLSLFLSAEEMQIVFLHVAVHDLLIWGIFHQIYLGSMGKKELLKKLFFAPCLLAVVLGIVLSVTGWELPGFLSYTVDALKVTAAPIALLFVGMLIHRYGILSWRGNRTAIGYTLWKVLLFPLLCFPVLWSFLPLNTSLVLALLLGSPAPVTAVLWSKEYGKDAKLAIHCLIPSTLLYFLLYGSLLLILTHYGILGV